MKGSFVFLMFLFVMKMESAHQLICHNSMCFGSMDQLSSLSDNVVIYYVRPDGLQTGDDRRDLVTLANGEKLTCGNTTESLLQDIYPWKLEENISLLPSCREKQTLKRISEPSESRDTPAWTLAQIIYEEEYAPCSIVSVTCKGPTTFSHFHLDNAPCLMLLGKELPSFLTTSININVAHNCNPILLSHMSGKEPFITHVRKKTSQKWDNGQMNTFVRFQHIEGHVLLDEMDGIVTEIDNASVVSYNYHANVSGWQVKHMTDVRHHMGLENVPMFSCGNVFGKNCQHHVLVHIFIHVALSLLCMILGFCACWDHLEKGKKTMLENKRE